MSEEMYNNQGTPQYNGDSGSGQNDSNGMAIASMVLGIASIVCLCINGYIAIICAIVGLVLGIMNNKKHTKSKMATAGIVCSIITLALWVVLLILGAIGIAALGGLSALAS